MAWGDNSTDRLFTLESGGDPEAVTGSNRGLGQFSPDLERKFGITNWKDPDQQRRAVGLEMNEFTQPLTQALGREPTPGEYYLAHQQGLAGAQAHLSNPDGVAWQNVAKYYPNASVARRAIWGNIPDSPSISPHFNKTLFPGGVDSVTSGDFANGWVGKFEGSSPAGSRMAMRSVPAAASDTGVVPSTGGMLAGTGALPETPMVDKATQARMASAIQPAQFRPIQIARPAGVKALLAAAALKQRPLV